jgi:manganese efflux pump family protein
MNVAALFALVLTVLAGLVLLMIWLMEYDRDFQTAAATRLPVPLISAHALLGLGGLMAWGLYVLTDAQQLEWATVADLGVVAVLGLVMAARWIGVYRAYGAPGSSLSGLVTVPPERHFPRPVIVIHGISAVVTVALVLLAVFFSGS